MLFRSFHGNLEPPNIAVQSRGETGAARPVPAGGAAYLASAIAALKAGHPNHAVISAGDLIGASPLVSALFLDEPTTGLDPRGRQEMWAVIRELVNDGTTLLLTTQYLEEADHLADEIAVIDTGKVIARGTSDELKRRIGGEHLELVVDQSDVKIATEIMARVSGQKIEVDEDLNTISAPVSTGTTALIEVLNELTKNGIKPLDIGMKRPSLDDVFLALTGHKAEV